MLYPHFVQVSSKYACTTTYCTPLYQDPGCICYSGIHLAIYTIQILCSKHKLIFYCTRIHTMLARSLYEAKFVQGSIAKVCTSSYSLYYYLKKIYFIFISIHCFLNSLCQKIYLVCSKTVEALLARSDRLLKLGIAHEDWARKLRSLTGINDLKIIIFVLYYLTVLVCI